MRIVTAGVAAIALLMAATPGMAAERGYQVAGFDRIRAAGPFDVEVRVGGPVSVRATGPQRAIDRLDIRSEGGQLVIRPVPGSGDGRAWFGRGERLVVRVAVPGLRAVALAGSGNVTIDRVRAADFVASIAGSGDLGIGVVQAERVSLSLAGSGDLSIAGRSQAVRVDLAGSGDIRATGLAARDAQVSLAGSGDIGLSASGAATVSLVGSGDVTVTGGARCTVARRGSGEVRCGG